MKNLSSLYTEFPKGVVILYLKLAAFVLILAHLWRPHSDDISLRRENDRWLCQKHSSTCSKNITPEQAMAFAVNDLKKTENGYRLRHPRHTATFSSDGLHFKPCRGDPQWHWQLRSVHTASKILVAVEAEQVQPVSEAPDVVRYRRGGIVEQYVMKAKSIEQQFVIPQPLELADEDLVIAGKVKSSGEFEANADGWLWRTDTGLVNLGKVTVVDATGQPLPATMTADSNMTRIVVDGIALAHAAYPVTIDPEIGTDVYRISDMGPDGNYSFEARKPAVAYNSTDNEYLVVWSGDDNTGSLANNEFEIFGQRLNAATGDEVGINDFRISDMGSKDGDNTFTAADPDVVYNGTNNEYLVVWSGDDEAGSLTDDELEVFGQRLAADGTEIGENDFRISDMGPGGNNSFEARRPVLAYNSAGNEYLVVWSGDDNTGSLTEDEFEIVGQRLDAATGAEVGINDFRISDMGATDGDDAFDAGDPDVAYNTANNEYLVVWSGDDDTGALEDHENEIFGQRLAAATGAEIGSNDFRISDMGNNDGDARFDAMVPRVAYNGTDNEYLVVWAGDDDSGSLADRENEIYGQRIDAATGAEVGVNDFRISAMGTTDGDEAYDADDPDVTYNSTNNEYLLVWEGVDDSGELIPGEKEILGQRLNATTGEKVGGNDFRISDMGNNDGDTRFDAYVPKLAYNRVNNEYLAVWEGEDDTGALVRGEFETLGQRINAATGEEVGSNDFRISDMGPNGNRPYEATEPAVAYNSINDEYLVVWAGDDNTGALVHGEKEIFGQRIDARTGKEVGINDFRISDMGPEGNTFFGAKEPAVAYNSANNEYLIVWAGDDDTGSLAEDEHEIFGQRLDARTGKEVGINDFRISDMGPSDGDPSFGAFSPQVTYNSMNNEYLVVWSGHDDTDSLADRENKIYGQRIDAASGKEIGNNDFRISDTGPDGNRSFQAKEPAVAYNRIENEYLVVWSGDDDSLLASEEFEIFAQLLAADGAEIGNNDFRISDMGADGDARFGAFAPQIAYNSADNEYQVVWSGDDDTGFLMDNEYEIFGQRLAAGGVEIGENDVRISDMGMTDGDDAFDANAPKVVYNCTKNVYLVVWSGDDDTGTLVNDEKEIFGQRLDAATGAEIGSNDFRISFMGPIGNKRFNALRPAGACSGVLHEYLVVWEGDDDKGSLEEGELEIFGLQFEDDEKSIPLEQRKYDMGQNFPNPFNHSTEINLIMPETGDVVVKVYTLTGQSVCTLVNRKFQRGYYTISWDGRNKLGNTVATGAYLYRITVHGESGEVKFVQTRRMTFLK